MGQERLAAGARTYERRGGQPAGHRGDLRDAATKELSGDWKFGIAYNASLKLCTVLFHCSGFRPEKNLAHYRTLQALPLILGKDHRANANYLEACRKKRNETEYDLAGGVSEGEAKELLKYGGELNTEVRSWLKKNHPRLI